MKFSVQCFVNSVNSNALPEAEASIKEVEVQNPKAQLSSVRAKAALAFRLRLDGFSLVYKGDRAATVDLSDEKRVISDCGLRDGDRIALVSKRVREDNGSEAAEVAPPPAAPPVTTTAVARGEETENPRKVPRVEEPGGSSGSSNSSSNSNIDDSDPLADGGSDEEEALEEGEVDLDLNAMAVTAMLGESADAAAGELYSRLLDVVPNLVTLRQEFLSNPQGVMQRIQREDPSLFQLITTHQDAFFNLINNEEAIATIQAEKDGGFYDGDDEELDEEAMTNLLGMLADGASGLGQDGDGEGDSEDDGMDLDPQDLNAIHAASGEGAKEVQDRILAFAPSEEDEQRIQQLTQLGFAYNVCKVAFYLSHRSLERAANRLFENPPQL